MQIYKIALYLFGLCLIVVFEEPRVSMLLSIIFPGEFSRVFSFALPALVLLVSITSYSLGENWKGKTSVWCFSGILILSYLNTVLVSVREAESAKSAQIEAVQGKLDSLQASLNSGKSARQCWAPPSTAENYSDLLAGYNSCLSASAAESETLKGQAKSISGQIAVQTADLSRLKQSTPDYWKPITQSAVGILLSVILGIGTGIFCLGLSSEINTLTETVNQSDDFLLAGLLAEKRSIREIAEKLGWSKGTAERRVREFRLVQAGNGIGNSRNSAGTAVGQSWDTSGTVWDTVGTEGRQPKKRVKNEDKKSVFSDTIFGSDFDALLIGAGRMS